ncbi:MAG: GNAT family N-acetyltransferase [Candidatus Zixiibacteriota bacterium]|nr:MAG: GNAT family N-acetyltransferase [candidate division Zixibacteria bacterium]
MNYRVITAEQDGDLVGRTQKRIGAEWPEFMLHDPVANYLTLCYEKLPRFQFVLTEIGSGHVVAIANSIPIQWDRPIEDLPDNGWDWALTKGIDDLRAGRESNILCALQIVVFSPYRGKGISTRVVAAMKRIGSESGLSGMIAPVRPNLKCHYPGTPIKDYIAWTDKNGSPFDPWLRVHFRLGAQIVKPCRTAMRITGTVVQWEGWTQMKFPKSGQHEVPGALVPVEMDLEADTGVYVEPNVWMYHSAS